MSEPFVAEIKIFAGNFAPRGWAFCDGQTLPISQNTALFSIVGTTYGGDGRTTLGLPDLQGRVPVHAGTGPGLTRRRLGQKGGTTSEILTTNQMPVHDHALNGTAAAPTAPGPSSSDVLAGALLYGAANGQTQLDEDVVGDAGGGQAHNNMQPYLGMHFIIALQGQYPSAN